MINKGVVDVGGQDRGLTSLSRRLQYDSNNDEGVAESYGQLSPISVGNWPTQGSSKDTASANYGCIETNAPMIPDQVEVYLYSASEPKSY